jgi:hypothetical protein
MVKFAADTRDMMTESNIKFILLKHTGEEILAYVLQNDKGRNYYLFSPAKITSVLNPLSGNMQYLMSEWISSRISDDEGFEVMASDILVIADVHPEMLKTYVQFKKRMDHFRLQIDDDVSVEDEVPEIQSVSDEATTDELSPEDEALLDMMSKVTPVKSTVH